MIRLPSALAWSLILVTLFGTAGPSVAETLPLKLRSIERDQTVLGSPTRVVKEQVWDLARTAVIVCDVWDLHHCLNAVRRLEEFAPRLDQVLKKARAKGAIVIHAPSDCMPAYAEHPARKRATETPKAHPPADIESWCSRLKGESEYPIDQSDGGEDDDPAEHAAWAAKLKAQGRNPGTPWKKQSDLITIDAGRDYISDRGDEVWNILEKHGIQHVILTGVHCNMCVLGRPFGLRQMVRNGKHVVLMRDMTDSMYSPKRWPYVDHFTGHDLVLDHVERFICPTITSDQLLGGEPFRWQADRREHSDTLKPSQTRTQDSPDLLKQWTTLSIDGDVLQSALKTQSGPLWYRGALRVPAASLTAGPAGLRLAAGKHQVWLNGHELQPRTPSPQPGEVQFDFPAEHVVANDYNLLVVKAASPEDRLRGANVHLVTSQQNWVLEPIWQVRLGDNPEFSNIPLPAKFGIGPDAVLRLHDLPDGF